MNAKSCGATADWANEWCTGGPEDGCHSMQSKGKGERVREGVQREALEDNESGIERGMKVGRVSDAMIVNV